MPDMFARVYAAAAATRPSKLYLPACETIDIVGEVVDALIADGLHDPAAYFASPGWTRIDLTLDVENPQAVPGYRGFRLPPLSFEAVRVGEGVDPVLRSWCADWRAARPFRFAMYAADELVGWTEVRSGMRRVARAAYAVGGLAALDPFMVARLV